MATRPARFCDTTGCGELITTPPADTTCTLCNGDVCRLHKKSERLAHVPHLMGLEASITLCDSCHTFKDKLWGSEPPKALAATFHDQLMPQILEHLKAAYAEAALTKADK